MVGVFKNSNASPIEKAHPDVVPVFTEWQQQQQQPDTTSLSTAPGSPSPNHDEL